MTWAPTTSSPTTTSPITSSPITSSVRLTRRGRALLLVLLVGLVLIAFSLGRVGSHADTGHAATAPLAQTTVHAGETLWAVAQRVAPGQDPRAVVQRIREINHLDGGVVQAGQQLLLPRVA